MRARKIQLDTPFFDDLPPEPKESEELTFLVLSELAGNKVDLSKYNEREIHRCVKQLILQSLVHGTVLGTDNCVWSRLTRKGKEVFGDLEKG